MSRICRLISVHLCFIIRRQSYQCLSSFTSWRLPHPQAPVVIKSRRMSDSASGCAVQWDAAPTGDRTLHDLGGWVCHQPYELRVLVLLAPSRAPPARHARAATCRRSARGGVPFGTGRLARSATYMSFVHACVRLPKPPRNSGCSLSRCQLVVWAGRGHARCHGSSMYCMGEAPTCSMPRQLDVWAGTRLHAPPPVAGRESASAFSRFVAAACWSAARSRASLMSVSTTCCGEKPGSAQSCLMRACAWPSSHDSMLSICASVAAAGCTDTFATWPSWVSAAPKSAADVSGPKIRARHWQ